LPSISQRLQQAAVVLPRVARNPSASKQHALRRPAPELRLQLRHLTSHLRPATFLEGADPGGKDENGHKSHRNSPKEESGKPEARRAESDLHAALYTVDP